jgi:hypothetical protein
VVNELFDWKKSRDERNWRRFGVIFAFSWFNESCGYHL